MQLETEVKPNGGAVIAAEEDEYFFDNNSLAVEVPHGDKIVTIAYTKPELEHYLARQKASQTQSQVVNGAIVGGEIKHDADTDFADLVMTGARTRKADGIAVIKEYSADECKRFTYELKVKFVKRITTWKFRVVTQGDDLLEPEGTLDVIQPIGEVNGKAVEITYTMNTLKPSQRQGFENAVKSASRFKSGDHSIEVEPHYIEKAMKLFGQPVNAFVSVSGGRLESGPFTPERRGEFVAQIDPLFQLGVISAICDFYGGGSD